MDKARYSQSFQRSHYNRDPYSNVDVFHQSQATVHSVNCFCSFTRIQYYHTLSTASLQTTSTQVYTMNLSTTCALDGIIIVNFSCAAGTYHAYQATSAEQDWPSSISAEELREGRTGREKAMHIQNSAAGREKRNDVNDNYDDGMPCFWVCYPKASHSLLLSFSLYLFTHSLSARIVSLTSPQIRLLHLREHRGTPWIPFACIATHDAYTQTHIHTP